MNLKQLEVLKAVMATGSTVGASAVLQLSQSAISRHLTALEADLGFDLFIRDKGRLIPRPEARALLPEVDELSGVLGRVKRKAAELKAGTGGDALIKVAFPHSMTTTVLPGVLAAFLSEFPKVIVEVLPGPYGAIEQMVQARTADLGFVRLPTEEPGFEARKLLRSGTLCVMRPDHPLAARDTVVLKDLARQELILIGRQRTSRDELEHALRSLGTPYRCRVEVHSVEAACACAAAGLGVAIVPELIGRVFHSAELAMRPFVPSLESDYGIISMPGAPLSRAAERFIALVMEGLSHPSVPERTPAPDRGPVG
jgi:DNA-binding transcriptional LysR family regulator